MNELSPTGIKLVKDLKTGRTGKGSLKDRKTIPGMSFAKNPWIELMKIEGFQERLNKVLDNYYGDQLKEKDE